MQNEFLGFYDNEGNIQRGAEEQLSILKKNESQGSLIPRPEDYDQD